MSSIYPEIQNLCSNLSSQKKLFVISRIEIDLGLISVTVPRAICRERLEAMKRAPSSILIWNSE